MSKRNSTAAAVVLTHQDEHGDPTVVVAGRLGMHSVARLRNAVLSARTETRTVLRIDLSRVSGVDRAGLRTLIACRRIAAAVDVELLLVRPSPDVHRRLAQIGLDRVLAVEQMPLDGIRREPRVLVVSL